MKQSLYNALLLVVSLTGSVSSNGLPTLRQIALNPDFDLEWTNSAETRYYKRNQGQQTSNSRDMALARLFSNIMAELRERRLANKQHNSADSADAYKRAWAGPGDIGFYKRDGTNNIYKRSSYEKNEWESSPADGVHKEADLLGKKRAGSGDIGILRRSGADAQYQAGKREGSGDIGFLKRFTVEDRAASSGDIGILKRHGNRFRNFQKSDFYHSKA